MKTTGTMAFVLLALAIATLAACGGGGSAGFDSTAFQGVWKYSNGTASDDKANCFIYDAFGGNYGALNRPIVITVTTLTTQTEVYADTSCTSYLGLIQQTYSLSWSAASTPGKSTEAHLLTTSTGLVVLKDGGAGLSLHSSPQFGVSTKDLIDVKGTQLYTGTNTSPKDAAGYPTELDSAPLFTR